MNNEQDQVITQTEAQRNPYLCRPEDFEISTGDQIASKPRPFHGQNGDSRREYERLLAIRHAKNKGSDLPTEVDNAGRPTRF